jgi:hypothetical protein
VGGNPGRSLGEVGREGVGAGEEAKIEQRILGPHVSRAGGDFWMALCLSEVDGGIDDEGGRGCGEPDKAFGGEARPRIGHGSGTWIYCGRSYFDWGGVVFIQR